MSHVPTVLKSDRSIFDKMLPVDDNEEKGAGLWFPLSRPSIQLLHGIKSILCYEEEGPVSYE